MAGSLSAGNSTSTTLPSTCVTRPSVRTAAVVMVNLSPRARSERSRPGDDLEYLRRDRTLTGLVVGQCQIVQQVVGIVGRVAHRHHLRRVEAGDGLQPVSYTHLRAHETPEH